MPITSLEEARAVLQNPCVQFNLFEISKTRGFLPTEDPVPTCEFIPFPLANKLQRLAENLPKYLAAGVARREIQEFSGQYKRENINESYHISRCSKRQKDALMRAFSFLANAYVFGSPGDRPADHLPLGIARPLYFLTQELGRHPILSYDSYALQNWRRIDKNGSIALDNIILLQNFLGGVDEEWFTMIHIEIEARAGRIPSLVFSTAKELADAAIPAVLEQNVSEIKHALARVNETMRRMPERCDPYIYYNRVRPYIHGWKRNPGLPNGVVYEGVPELGGVGQTWYYGETGAQSSIFPLLYAFFGVKFNKDTYLDYLYEMREYMPQNHREFIIWIEALENAGISVIGHARETKNEKILLECKGAIDQMVEFLKIHFGYAQSYIERQHQKSLANPTSVGTGGSHFIKFLDEHVKKLEKFSQDLAHI